MVCWGMFKCCSNSVLIKFEKAFNRFTQPSFWLQQWRLTKTCSKLKESLRNQVTCGLLHRVSTVFVINLLFPLRLKIAF